ncbi:retrotransposon hot spot (RHS) protein [Trypanosoma cruzi]|nr:retrotransposon hot spot (RHS) protein [Trypanosoma cruzi]
MIWVPACGRGCTEFLQSVCGDGGATRVRGPWRAVCVEEPSAPTTLLLLALTNTVLGGCHPLAVVAAVLVHVVCTEYCVDGFLVVASIHDCAYCLSFSHSPFLLGGYCLDLTQTKKARRNNVWKARGRTLRQCGESIVQCLAGRCSEENEVGI